MEQKETALSHLNRQTADVQMVNIQDKNTTQRRAIARSTIQVSEVLFQRLQSNDLEKGNVFTIAKTAAVLAAKDTARLIPLCHSLYLDVVDITFSLEETTKQIHIQAEAVTSAKTGVEMEALTAVTIAGLTVYDMCKSLDKKMMILHTGLYKKEGGKSGTFINNNLER